MKYEELNDYEIVSYISENIEEAKEIIFKKYTPLIHDRANKFFPYCKNYGIEINDLIQEGMIGLNDAITKYDNTYTNIFYTFALKCVDSIMISYIVKLGRMKNKILNESVNLELSISDKSNNFGKNLVDNSYNPEEILIRKENKEEIFKIMDKVLSETEKEALNLKINGFTYKEIADILDKPVKTIDSTIQRAKSKLKERLNDKV